jgi:hypothetical protein
MKTKLLLVILLGLAIPSVCQKKGQEKLDSLFAVLRTSKQDSTQVTILNQLAYEYRRNNPIPQYTLPIRRLHWQQK